MNSKTILQLLYTVLVRFFSKAANFVVFIILIRTLSLDDFGVYGALYTSVFLISVVLDVGIRNSSATYISGNRKFARKLMPQLHFLWLIMSIVGFFLLLNLWDLVAIEATEEIFLPYYIYTCFILYIRMFQGVYIGLSDIKSFNKSEILSKFSLLTLVLLLYVFDEVSLLNVFWMLALSQAIAVSFVLWTTLVSPGWQWSIDYKGIGQVLRRGWMFMLAVLMMLLSKKLSIYVVNEHMGAEAAGIYFSMLRFSEIATEIALGISVVLLSKVVSNRNSDTIIVAARYTSGLLIFLSFSMIMASWLILEYVISIGVEYREEFLLIVLATLASSIFMAIFPSIAAVRPPLEVSVLFIPGVIVYLSMIFWGNYIADTSVFGFSVMYLIVSTITLVLFLYYVARKLNTSLSSLVLLKFSDISAILQVFKRNG